jgi:hypothetical protein
LGDLKRFYAILGDFGRFWAILGDFMRFLGDFGRFWAITSQTHLVALPVSFKCRHVSEFVAFPAVHGQI